MYLRSDEVYDSGWFYWLHAKNATPQTALKKRSWRHICKVCHVVTSWSYPLSIFPLLDRSTIWERVRSQAGCVTKKKYIYDINYRVNRKYVLRLHFLYWLRTCIYLLKFYFDRLNPCLKKRILCPALEKYSRAISSSSSKSILDAR